MFKNSKTSAHLSDPLFRYTDVAISKKEKQLKLESIEDLSNFSIAAYQGAKDLLGEQFKIMTLSNLTYVEHPHPKNTTLAMLAGKKDIRIGDINIFYFDLKNQNYNNNDIKTQEFDIHHLWPDVYSHMAFKDEILRDKVNIQIKNMSEDGSLENIYKQYIKYP
ncbi:ABC transporter substrate-binding protein [Pseudoalteromonas sp. HL-AS1]|uniref:ABC transporter substrate-binding protein n=2 Tax=unclassified Pseudoalteromonas TaxID=194690 RepID=UPI002814E871|nr:ABC transporter substrate-binding protein [Pseudoalteromonas sp. HL-AS1]WMS92503.1 ABC transporter substrate-binding protein [Pseudoalteromonas sp. HL-AS1]